MTVLPDVLAPNLKVVFCGTAAGTRSANVGAYYAGLGNRFWPVLHEVGLTPRQLEPAEFHDVLRYGIGLTDLAKRHSGPDGELPKGAFDVDALRKKIEYYQPRVLAFNGKTAARGILQREQVDYGIQARRDMTSRIFVCPSTSGNATRWWDKAHWVELGRLCQR